MSVTIPSDFPALDFEVFSPGIAVVADPQALRIIEGENFLYGNHRQTAGSFEGQHLGVGASGIHANGIWQGTGSMSGSASTADGSTYVERLSAFYPARAVTDDAELLTLITYAEVDTADGGVQLDVCDFTGSSILTVTNAHTTGTNPSLVAGVVAASGIDTGVVHHIKIKVMAGTSGWVRLYRWALFETRYIDGGSPALP